MVLRPLLLIIVLFISSSVRANDTLYFRLSNPWNTVKSPAGKYLRKCVKEKDYYHAWDYNSKNILVTESFYSDTNFTFKLYCHKYYNEQKGFLEQTRCYENGRLNGYWVDYDEKGDTTDYHVFKDNEAIKSWSKEPDNGKDVVMIEENAEFPGGIKAWGKYLSDNLYYPKSLKKKNIHGQMLVKFYVSPSGEITQVDILKSLDPLLDETVISVLKNSPKWKPAKQNGKEITETFPQPITF